VEPADNLAELAQLLPFYANGTLGADDRARLDFALAASPELQAELEVVQQLGILVHAGGKALCGGQSAPSAEYMARLMARIKKGSSSSPAPLPLTGGARQPHDCRSWLVGLFARRWAVALSLGLVALIGWQAGRQFSGTALQSGEETYLGASGPDATSPGRTDIVIQSAPNAEPQAIEALLASEGLTMIRRDDDGLIALRTAKRLSPSEVDALITRLRASPLIAFAGAGA
jgi:hypothetical protein